MDLVVVSGLTGDSCVIEATPDETIATLKQKVWEALCRCTDDPATTTTTTTTPPVPIIRATHPDGCRVLPETPTAPSTSTSCTSPCSSIGSGATASSSCSSSSISVEGTSTTTSCSSSCSCCPPTTPPGWHSVGGVGGVLRTPPTRLACHPRQLRLSLRGCGTPLSPDVCDLSGFAVQSGGEVTAWGAPRMPDIRTPAVMPCGGEVDLVEAGGGICAVACSSHIDLWDVERGCRAGRIPTPHVYEAAVSPCGEWILACSGTADLWCPGPTWGTPLRRSDLTAAAATFGLRHTPYAYRAAVSPCGSRAAVSDGTSALVTLQLEPGTGCSLLSVLRQGGGGGGGGGGGLAFSRCGSLLAAASPGNVSVEVWDAASGVCLRRLVGLQAQSVAFSPDASSVVGCGVGGMRVWRVGGVEEEEEGVLAAASPTGQAAVTPCGRYAVCSHGGRVVLRKFPSGREVHVLHEGAFVMSLALSPCGGWVFYNSDSMRAAVAQLCLP